MTQKNLLDNYAEFYDKASTLPQQNDSRELKLFSSLLDSYPEKKSYSVLDLGCAEGQLALALAKKGHQVSAADISPQQLTKVKQLAETNHVSMQTVLCDIEEGINIFANEQYDFIYFMDIIEHLRNPVLGLKHIRTLLADNGRLIIHTPNVFTFERWLPYLRHKQPFMNYYALGKLGDLHFQTYDYLTLEKTLNFVGFKVERLIPTRLTIRHCKPSAWLAKYFPFFADTLLLICKKEAALDLETHIQHWEQRLIK